MSSKNFSIKETVNKNIEKNQFPSFTNYRSMAGWCSMNYPKTLVNPIYMDKEVGVPDEKKYDLNYLFQKKNPLEREKAEFIKPFSTLEKKSEQGANFTKNTSMTLATTPHELKQKIVIIHLCSLKKITKLLKSFHPCCHFLMFLGPTMIGILIGK